MNRRSFFGWFAFLGWTTIGAKLEQRGISEIRFLSSLEDIGRVSFMRDEMMDSNGKTTILFYGTLFTPESKPVSLRWMQEWFKLVDVPVGREIVKSEVFELTAPTNGVHIIRFYRRVKES
jgi:hypothetical protein